MNDRSKRRRMLHRTGLLTLLVGGAMLLSGCWGLVVGPDESGKKAVVISERFTNQIVYTHCGGTTTDSAARCALNAIRGLCTKYPLKGMSYGDCAEITVICNLGGCNSSLIPEMQGALSEVIHSSDVCLVGYFKIPAVYVNWKGSPRGFACG